MTIGSPSGKPFPLRINLNSRKKNAKNLAGYFPRVIDASRLPKPILFCDSGDLLRLSRFHNLQVDTGELEAMLKILSPAG
jgi:hypothetical protein